ncbi:hypothetical protein K0M31_011823 [Melipona bicolor]|uniref:Uncharacterized protein n=1 Tax=Melipona bicolor TaxID=60889 RepID=A0AA40GAA2_9HYME|nr:hypothetical protein K0M31_011823 [Melipona bicolor]
MGRGESWLFDQGGSPAVSLGHVTVEVRLVPSATSPILLVGVHGGLSDSGWLCMVARHAMTTPRENREVNTDTESKKIQADR